MAATATATSTTTHDPTQDATHDPTTADDAHVNQVHLRGRVSAEPQERELPSGDRLVTARLVVVRPPGPARQRQAFDVLNCVAWTARARRLVAGWQPGSVVEVEGSIRRRFRRGPNGLTSWVEVEVAGARRVRAAAPEGSVSAARSRRRA
jgi:single-strand DNA-binding protein